MGLVTGEEASTQRVGDLPLVAARFAAAVPFATAGASNTLLVAEVPVAAIREAVGERVELVMLVLNPDKAIVDGKRLEIDWKSFKAERVFEYAGIALTAGRYDCRAVIRNLDDGRAAAGSCVIEVPELATEGASLYPPFFFVRGPAASYINIESEKKAEGVEPFSLSRVFPFPSKEYVPLVGAMERGAGLLGAVLRCEWRGDRSGEIDLDVRLFPEAGGEEIEIAANLQDMKSEGTTDLYLISIDLPELPPGRYRLGIEGANAATGSTARTSGLFLIR